MAILARFYKRPLSDRALRYMFVCFQDIDECEIETQNCSNDATCTNVYGGYNCSCQDGFEGELCERGKFKNPN